mmetsp:Transcript_28728/g.61664  ORF Transcript_28728/g.61664 Transcript_28728/m.61664 type:complete len:101 (+) Transcript_28728:161-463(+)
MAKTSNHSPSANPNQQQNHRHHQQQHLNALEQLFEEQDHKRCSEGNRKALLAENLDKLRGLAKVLEADDWIYHSSSSGNNSVWSSAHRTTSSSGGGSNNA